MFDQEKTANCGEKLLCALCMGMWFFNRVAPADRR